MDKELRQGFGLSPKFNKLIWVVLLKNYERRLEVWVFSLVFI